MTVTVKNRSNLIVPTEVQRRAGYKAGDRLEFRVSGSVVTIVPEPPAADEEYTPAQRRTIDRSIAQSEKEYKQGRSFGPFASHTEFLASLHKEAAKLRRAKAKRPVK